MIIQSEHIHVELENGSTLVLAKACGSKLTCVAGTIWITQHHRSNDWVLNSGEILTIVTPGKVIVSACNGSARFSVQQRLNEHAGRGVNQTWFLGNLYPSMSKRIEA